MGHKQRITFPVQSFRHVETPFAKRGLKNYYAIVELDDLPDLSDWRKINVRDPKLTGQVPRKIRESVRDSGDMFVFMNRGIVLSVQSAKFDNQTNELTIVMDDPVEHGLLDGGHTYNILLEERADLDEYRYVKLEILEGFAAEEIPQLVDARNTSNQVRDESLMNLQGAFDGIRKALKGAPYANLVAYKEYEYDDEGNAKPIDVREVIAILAAFDRKSFTQSQHPINSYRSKVACLKHFKENQEHFKPLYPLAKSILELYDEIELTLPDLYNRARPNRGDVSGGRFGKLTGVTTYKNKKKGKTLFLQRPTDYGVPTGFIYPVLGAFRALIEETDDGYQWAEGIDPLDMLAGEMGETLAETIGNFAREDRNPSKTGKSILAWQSCYQGAQVAYYRSR